MGFTWTKPDPLSDYTTVPSTIGGEDRFVVGTFVIYFQEIFDAINELRVQLGQPEIASSTWGLYPEAGDTLLQQMIIDLQLWIDTLIVDYEYTSEVDILGREWADYQLDVHGQYYAKWQIIQDFRDVLDALQVELEEWKIFESEQPTKQVFQDYDSSVWQLDLLGDLGTYINESRWNTILYTKYSNLSYAGVLQDTVYSDFNWERNEEESKLIYQSVGGGYSYQNDSFLIKRGYSQCLGTTFFLKDADDKNIVLSEDKLLKMQIEMSADPAYVYSEAWAIYGGGILPTDPMWYSYPTFQINLSFKCESRILNLIYYFSQDPTYNTIGTRTTISDNIVNVEIGDTLQDINGVYDIYKYLKLIPGWVEEQVYQLVTLQYLAHPILTYRNTTGGGWIDKEMNILKGFYDIRINKVGLIKS